MEFQPKTLTFVESVLTTPKMYTVNGTFGEAIAFLTGWYSALSKLPKEKYSFAATECRYWFEFKMHLFEQVSEQANIATHMDMWQVLQSQYGDDTVCANAIKKQYVTFIQSL